MGSLPSSSLLQIPVSRPAGVYYWEMIHMLLRLVSEHRLGHSPRSPQNHRIEKHEQPYSKSKMVLFFSILAHFFGFSAQLAIDSASHLKRHGTASSSHAVSTQIRRRFLPSRFPPEIQLFACQVFPDRRSISSCQRRPSFLPSFLPSNSPRLT